MRPSGRLVNPDEWTDPKGSVLFFLSVHFQRSYTMRRIITTTLLFLGSAATATASAATFGLHLGSVHIPAKDWHNNVNPGIYYQADSGFTAGFYRNTLRRNSVYAGYTFERGPFGLTVGAVSGYQKHRVGNVIYGVSNAVLVPMVAPSVKLPQVTGLTPRISFIPGLAGSANVLHLSVERRF